MYCSQKILVTGAAGFIGSNFVKFILSKYKNNKIISLDKLTYAGNLNNLTEVKNNPNHIFIKGDICDGKLISLLLREHSIDTIVHFAAESHVDRSITSPKQFIETNVLGSFELLNEAKKYWLQEKNWNESQCRFHHISTDEVYGSLAENDNPFTEQTAYSPNSPYSASKASSDHLVRSYYHTYGLPVTISNCSNNYGPHQHSEKMIPTIIRSCLEGLPIPIYGDGSNIRDWLYVEDHCLAIDAILKHGKVGETYNIGGNCEIKNIDLAKIICHFMNELKPQAHNYLKQISFVTDRPGHDKRYAIDNKKITQTLNWNPTQNIETGLRKTLNYYLNSI